MIGQRLSCMVVTKNEFGVLATNYQLPAYTMLIMKMPDDTSDALDRIQRGSYIEIEVLAYQLKADNAAEHIRAEYWLICSLANAKVDEVRYQILPPVATRPDLIANNRTYDLETINDKRRELTGGAYADLEETKNSIQNIRNDYINMLREKEQNIHKDIMLSAMLGKNRKDYVMGILQKQTGSVHNVEIIWPMKKTDGIREINVRPNRESVNTGAVILYRNVSAAAANYNILDFWGRHVKYVINETEMVHPNGQYLNQLTKIIYSQPGVIKSSKQGTRKIFTENGTGRSVATIIYRNPHVISSRAYYKMREFILFFGTEIFSRDSMKIACIAESPGGFIQALLDQRVYDPTSKAGPIETGIRDDIVAISIGINGSPWTELEAKIRKDYKYVHLRHGGTEDRDPERTNVKLFGGSSGEGGGDDGDILDAGKRASFYSEFEEEKADLITGDAGIERNKKETTEEMDTHPLLLAEIIMALNCQKQGGSFILKIFDMATEFTMNMLQVLCYCYDEVGLFKPSTSRAASSEKYLVCKRFQVDEPDRLGLIKQLEAIHAMKLATPANADTYYGNMLGLEDAKLKQAIVSYNVFFMKKQITFIEGGRIYATMYNNTIRSGNVEKMTFDILAKIGVQVSTADEFLAKI
jgi:23S rRNA U2552 (ribose-2'-O)-methylase RlmE/FtsJ